MKARNFLITVTLLLTSLCISAQSVQYGYTEEYRGANEKTPLKGVNIMAGGATTKSDKTGKFRLDFTTLKVGDKVDADLRSVANLKGYVLFNKEAVEQWTVSGKSVYFRIVLCKQKDFDAMVKNYYNVSDKAYKEKLQKERDRADKLKKEGEIQQQEYERLLKEAEERYNEAFKNLKENAELVARIDESELEGNQAQILQLAKEGKLDEAVELIRQSNTEQLLDNVTKKNAHIDEQIALYEQKKEETKAELSKLIERLKNEIKILKLAGGKESFDLCGEKWTKIAEADTTNLENLISAAKFFMNQKYYETAEHYLFIAMRGYEEKMKTDPDGNGLAYVEVLNRIATIYDAFNRPSGDTYDYYHLALKTVKELAEKNPDKYNRHYATTLCTVGTIRHSVRRFDEVLDYYTQALNIQKALVEKETDDVINSEYATTINNIGALYHDKKEYAEAEKYYLQSLAIRKSLAEKDPDTYTGEYASSIRNMGILLSEMKQDDKAVECYTQALQIYKQLADKNPDSYTSKYARALYSLGYFYSNRGNQDKADQYYVEALTIFKQRKGVNILSNEDYAWAAYRAAHSALDKKHYAEAEEYARECVELKPEGRLVKDALLFALLLNGKYEEAEKIAGEIFNEYYENAWYFDGILEDLKEYEEKGIIPDNRKADVERMRNFILKDNLSSQESDNPSICFTPRNGSMTMKFDIKNVTHTIQYSTDGTNWKTYNSGTGIYILKDHSIYFRAEKNQSVATAFGDSLDVNCSHFDFNTAFDGTVECSGNIMSLYGPDCPNLPLQPYSFAQLFINAWHMTTAPQLPATTLAEYCYQKMFVSCFALTTAPALPATTLASHCYEYMFLAGRKLKTPPALPATTLADYCYYGMFLINDAINTLPELPATTLAEGCYQSMFGMCKALKVNTEGPGREWSIPAKTTAKDALERMFLMTSGTMNTTPEVNTTYYIQSEENK